MKVKDLMSTTVTACRAGDSLDHAARLMWEHDCGCLPVVDAAGRVEAVVTDRDICMAAWSTGRPLGAIAVRECMSPSAATCGVDETLPEATRRMGEHGVRRLPVVDGDGKIAGLLSLNDLACASAGHDQAAVQALELLRAVSRHRGEASPRDTLIARPAAAATTPTAAKAAAKGQPQPQPHNAARTKA